jgi:hypothetical protein
VGMQGAAGEVDAFGWAGEAQAAAGGVSWERGLGGCW